MFDYTYIIYFIIGGTFVAVFKYMKDNNIAPKYISLLAALPISLILSIFITTKKNQYITGSIITLSTSVISFLLLLLLNNYSKHSIINYIIIIALFIGLTVLKIKLT